MTHDILFIGCDDLAGAQGVLHQYRSVMSTKKPGRPNFTLYGNSEDGKWNPTYAAWHSPKGRITIKRVN